MPALPLYQQLFLAAHDEQGETLIHLPSLGLALTAAIVLDLVLRERMAASGGQLAGLGADPVGDPVLEPLFRAVAAAPPHPAGFWLRSFGPDQYEAVSQLLLASGSVRASSRRRLGFQHRVLIPAEPVARARIQTDVLRMVRGEVESDPVHGALCGLLGVLRLERTLDVYAGESFRRRMLAIAAEQIPDAPVLLEALDRLLGETAIAARR